MPRHSGYGQQKGAHLGQQTHHLVRWVLFQASLEPFEHLRTLAIYILETRSLTDHYFTMTELDKPVHEELNFDSLCLCSYVGRWRRPASPHAGKDVP